MNNQNKLSDDFKTEFVREYHGIIDEKKDNQELIPSF
jgi:hypothetical protein